MTLTGSFYAFYGDGKYEITQNFGNITHEPMTAIQQYDLTSALQVTMDVRTFNQKLGIFKAADNISLVSSQYRVGTGSTIYYNIAHNYFSDSAANDAEVESISLSADEFRLGMTSSSQVISVGIYSSMYSDFINLVKEYFGYAGGFASLFSKAETFNPNNGVFDSAAFIRLLSASTSTSSNYPGAGTTNISGSITIDNIVEVLRFAVETNCFGNRSPGAASAPGGQATDPSNNQNYGVSDGFIAGDLIWVPEGTTIHLNLAIDSEFFASIASITNNVGPQNTAVDIASLNSSSSLNFTRSGATFSSTSSSTVNNISRVLTAPLLIRLDNLSSAPQYPPSYVTSAVNAIPVTSYASYNTTTAGPTVWEGTYTGGIGGSTTGSGGPTMLQGTSSVATSNLSLYDIASSSYFNYAIPVGTQYYYMLNAVAPTQIVHQYTLVAGTSSPAQYAYVQDITLAEGVAMYPPSLIVTSNTVSISTYESYNSTSTGPVNTDVTATNPLLLQANAVGTSSILYMFRPANSNYYLYNVGIMSGPYYYLLNTTTNMLYQYTPVIGSAGTYRSTSTSFSVPSSLGVAMSPPYGYLPPTATAKTLPILYDTIACSTTGQQVAFSSTADWKYIYVATNQFSTLTPANYNVPAYGSVYITKNGTTAFVCQYGAFYKTTVANLATVTLGPSNQISNILTSNMSSDYTGQIILAFRDRFDMYFSTNGGTSFTRVAAQPDNCRMFHLGGGCKPMGVSKDGTFAFIGNTGESNNCTYKISRLSGGSWSTWQAYITDSVFGINTYIQNVSISSDGQYIYAITNYNTLGTTNVWVNNNYGALNAWTKVNGSGVGQLPTSVNFTRNKISDSGKHAVISAPTAIYYTKDYGVTWIDIHTYFNIGSITYSNWNSVEISGASEFIYAVAKGSDNNFAALCLANANFL